MKITVFGSCRQHSLASHHQLTSIQETLTYPHYTKEIIQAIEYCKGTASPAVAAASQYCFRSGILAGRQITYQHVLAKEFADTDLFVVEIASRISYELSDDVYVHHILAEEDKYGFPDRSAIRQRDLTDEEIEADVLRIRDLLAPAKLLVVSHIATRQTGKRYELVKLLERITAAHGIPFLNPADALHGIDDLYEDETACHYTSKGHYLIGYALSEAISGICS